MSALSIDSSVSLLEPAAAQPAAPARWGRPTQQRAAAPRTTAPRSTAPLAPRSAAPQSALREHALRDATPEALRHGRRAARPASPRARRASAASTLSPAVVGGIARRVAVRALGIGVAAAAVTVALASKGEGTGPAALAMLSVRGLAVAAILCAAWGFQDRPRLGTLQTVRAWYGTAAVIGLAHALWIQAVLPGRPGAHVAAALSAFALDAVLVAAPALLGARAGRPDVAVG